MEIKKIFLALFISTFMSYFTLFMDVIHGSFNAYFYFFLVITIFSFISIFLINFYEIKRKSFNTQNNLIYSFFFLFILVIPMSIYTVNEKENLRQNYLEDNLNRDEYRNELNYLENLNILLWICLYLSSLFLTIFIDFNQIKNNKKYKFSFLKLLIINISSYFALSVIFFIVYFSISIVRFLSSFS